MHVGRSRLVAVVLGVIVAGAALTGTYLWFHPAPAGAGPGVAGGFEVNLSAPIPGPSPDFWGVNVLPTSAPAPAVTASVEGSPVTFARFPGGLAGERDNLSANALYNDSGSAYTPPFSLTSFIAWCKALNCHAILELPAEIDSPSTAAYEVAYT